MSNLSSFMDDETAVQTTLSTELGNALTKFYDENPTANAYGTEIEFDGRRHTFFVGRDTKTDSGFEYCYFRRPERGSRGEETVYIYGKYGWLETARLLNNGTLLELLLESFCDKDYITQDAVDRFRRALTQTESELTALKNEFDLTDIAELFQSKSYDKLKLLLATDEETSRNLWQIVFSKDSTGDTIENEITTPVIGDTLLLVRADRFFQDDYREPDGKYYTAAFVVGIDDTDDVFFVHRLESDPDIRDETFDWTLRDVRQKMGFDIDIHSVFDATNIPFDQRVRVQGDISLTRRDFTTIYTQYFETLYETELQDLYNEAQIPYLLSNTFTDNSLAFYRSFSTTTVYKLDEKNTQLSESTDRILDTRPSQFDSKLFSVRNTGDDIRLNSTHTTNTDALKNLQTLLGISEETIREKQDAYGYTRLTANRREKLLCTHISDLLENTVFTEQLISRDTFADHVDQLARKEFTNTATQVNIPLGNHIAVLQNAREHPNEQYTREHDILSCIVVPDESHCVFWHDEHETQTLTLGPGVYEIQFLDGFETEWWMN